MNEQATAMREAAGVSASYGWVGPIGAGLTAGVVDLFVAEPAILHAGLLALLVAGTGLAGWRITARSDIAAVSAITAGLWSIPYTVPASKLWVAAIPLALLLAPSAWLQTLRDAGLALIAAALGALAAFAFSLGPITITLAGAGAFLLVVARPEVPTRETLSALRALALFGPGLALLGLVGVNAGTEWLEVAEASQALALGVGLAGLLALTALALLGLVTLLASSDPSQATAWIACALTIVVLLAVVFTKDLNLLRAAGAFAVAPVAILATISAARVRTSLGEHSLARLLPPMTALAQIGLL